jgi:hypothetical protein
MRLPILRLLTCILLSSCGRDCVNIFPTIYHQDEQWVTYYDKAILYQKYNGKIDSLDVIGSGNYYIYPSEDGMVGNGDTCLGDRSAIFTLEMDSLTVSFQIIKYPLELFADPVLSSKDTMQIVVSISDRLNFFGTFDILDTASMRHSDTLSFNGYKIPNAYDNKVVSASITRFIVTPDEKIIYLELSDGRHWTKQEFATPVVNK